MTRLLGRLFLVLPLCTAIALRRPCLDPGHSLTAASLCPPNTTLSHLQSPLFTLHHGRLVARHRLCLLSGARAVPLLVTCDGRQQVRTLLLEREQKHYAEIPRYKRSPGGITFPQASYEFELAEEGTATLITIFGAQNPDGLPIFYSVDSPEDPRSDKFFRINRTTGELSTTGPLDRELMSEHRLRVTGRENGNPSRFASVPVLVSVTDLNDHVPVFEKKTFIASISESAEIGTTVLHVHARDDDEGDNGRVRYSFRESQTHFSIHPVTGIVQIAQSLDRELEDFYRLTVEATDAGSPIRSSSALVEISIVDANDNHPQFEQASYKAEVAEDTDPKVKPLVARVRATDADAGENGRVRYSIVSGNIGDKFAVDYESGDLSLLSELSYKLNPMYRLVIRAQDGGAVLLSNTTVLEIAVIDVNDNPPEFYTTAYEETVLENVPENSQVTLIQAYDPDDGRNADILYRFKEGTGDIPFELDPRTGRVRTTGMLDRETMGVYRLVVEATDSGTPPLAASVPLTITIVDVDDNRPVFTHKTFNVTLREDAHRGQEVVRVRAVDADENSVVSYTISAGNDPPAFIILKEDDSGLLRLNGRLDFRKKSLYSLTVKATDQTGKSDTATVWVYVEDVNSAPTFLAQPLRLSVSEAEAVNGTVAVVEAEDGDDGPNALLRYHIGGHHGHFRIDPERGVITVAKPLDRERRPNYNLRVTVSDGGEPPLSTSTTLEIVLSDVNDNQPVFLKANYSVSIPEDAKVGNSFLQVGARDADAGVNAQLTYAFAEDGANSTFFIDPSSGIIRILEPLDRETVAEYYLQVIATDKGSPALSGSTWLHIIIEDLNDNPPRFEWPTYLLHVPEDKPKGSVVGRIVARDADSGTNAQVQYTIAGGLHAHLFGLRKPKQGEGVDVVMNTNLDFESSVNTYHFQLKASSGELSSSVSVEVRVLDTNDNGPSLPSFTILFNNYPGHFPLARLGRIPAFDPDLNDTLVYSIPKGNEAGLLELNADTGEIRLSPSLNTNRHLRTQMTACVTDGANEVCAMCELEVVMVTPDMLAQSLTVRGRGRTASELLSPVPLAQLREAIATLLPSRPDHVHIFSIMESESGLEEPVVNISFAIRRHDSDHFVPVSELRELVDVSRVGLGRVAGLEILPLQDSYCLQEPCPGYQECESVLKFAAASDFLATSDFLFRPVTPTATFRCRCPPGFAGSGPGSQCDMEVNLCYSGPCLGNSTCVALEGGYRCECPPDTTGRNCEFPLSGAMCVPGICQGGSKCTTSATARVRCLHCPFPLEDATETCELRGRTFQRGHWLSLPPLRPRYRFSLAISVGTVEADGLMLYNGRFQAQHDFLAVYIRNRLPTVSISLGGDARATLSLPDVEENRVSDGKWHRIHVSYDHKLLRLWLDSCPVEVTLGFAADLNSPPCAAELRLPACSDCLRSLDLSGPLYLAALPGNKESRLQPGEPRTLEGCLRDVELDGVRVDLGTPEIERQRGGSEAGCRQKADVCDRHRPCDRSSQCSNIWAGHHCRCHNGRAGPNCTEIAFTSSLHLASGDSYVEWNATGGSYALPMEIGILIRTRQKTANPLNLVLSNGRRESNLLFKMRDGALWVELEEYKWTLAHAPLSDGAWHRVSLRLGALDVLLAVDGGSSRSFLWQPPPTLTESLVSVASAFVGSLPGSSHPTPYLGCVKALYVRKAMAKQGGYLTVQGHYGTRRDCEQPPNVCLGTTCPFNAICSQDWDKAVCRCLPGYFGKDCKSACSLEGLCQNGGVCDVGGPAGYRCNCKTGWTGKHCEAPLGRSGWSCPGGWWGQPLCGPCSCDTHKGFAAACHRLTGECRCEENHYRPPGSDRCLPCNCHFPLGAAGPTCDSLTGQCSCRGNVVGRACDSCENARAEIDVKTGLCKVVRSGCPARLRGGVSWSRGSSGRTQRRGCPGGSSGEATRFCDLEGLWSSPSLSNCSSNAFAALRTTLEQLDSREVEMTGYLAKATARQLRNATHPIPPTGLFPADVYAGYRLSMALLRYETEAPVSQLLHMQDKHFVGGLLLDELEEYGKSLTALHHATSLPPFHVAAPNIVFAVDAFNPERRPQLPKFDNFIQPLGEFPQSFALRLPTTSKGEKPAHVFYAAYANLGDLMDSEERAIVSPILSVSLREANGRLMEGPLKSPLELFFPYALKGRYSNPRCARWEPNLHKWSELDCLLWDTNATHVTCRCGHLSSFTVLADRSPAQSGILGKEMLAFLRPAMGIVMLTILSVVVVFLVCLRRAEGPSNRRTIQLCITVTGFLLSLGLLLVSWARVEAIGCSVVRAALDAASVALFGWLLAAAAETWRSVTQVDAGSVWPYLLPGLLCPILTASLSAAFTAPSHSHPLCWFELSDPLIWLMLAPIALFLLMTAYALVMCVLIAFSKEWDLVFTKLNFRSSLIWLCLVWLSGLLWWGNAVLALGTGQAALRYAELFLGVLFAVLLLLWAAAADKRNNPPDLKTAVNLWLSEDEGNRMTTSICVPAVPHSPAPPPPSTRHPLQETNQYHAEPRVESPLLSDDMAPLPEDEEDHYRLPHADSRHIGEGQPFLTPTRIGAGNRRPDVVPSWEESQLPSSPSQSSACSMPTRLGLASAAYSRHYATAPRSLTPQSSSGNPPILSPVQAVLYGRTESDYAAPPDSILSGYSTFSPRRSPRTTLSRRTLDSEDVGSPGLSSTLRSYQPLFPNRPHDL